MKIVDEYDVWFLFELFLFYFLSYNNMKINCVRCWIHTDKWMWCEKCRKRVDEEINWEVQRPFQYYFRYLIKKNKWLNKWSNVPTVEKQ